MSDVQFCLREQKKCLNWEGEEENRCGFIEKAKRGWRLKKKRSCFVTASSVPSPLPPFVFINFPACNFTAAETTRRRTFEYGVYEHARRPLVAAMRARRHFSPPPTRPPSRNRVPPNESPPHTSPSSPPRTYTLDNVPRVRAYINIKIFFFFRPPQTSRL